MKPELMTVAQRIDGLCDSIGRKSEAIAKFAASEKLANALAEYDKAIELAIVQLQSEGVPATIIKPRAKGMCKDQLFAVKSLEITWKAMLSIIESTESRLNGQQSIYKHLDET